MYGGPVDGTWHFLCLEFGPDNRLVEVKTFEAGTVDKARQELLAWIESRRDAGDGNALPAAPAEAAVAPAPPR